MRYDMSWQWSILVSGFMEGAWENFEPHCDEVYYMVDSNDASANSTRFCIQLNIGSMVTVIFTHRNARLRLCSIYNAITNVDTDTKYVHREILLQRRC